MRCSVAPISASISSPPLPPPPAAAPAAAAAASAADGAAAADDGATLGGTEATCTGIGTEAKPAPSPPAPPAAALGCWLTIASTHLQTGSMELAHFFTIAGEKLSPQLRTNSVVVAIASVVG